MKMKNEKYLNDLGEIKEIMQRSSRFISLSGLSGVLSGIYALFGAYFAWGLLYDFDTYFSRELITYIPAKTLFLLFLDAATVLFLSLFTGFILTYKKAKKQNRSVYDVSAKRLLINLFIPLIAGGLFLLILLEKGFVGIIAPGTLIFYGLALINASKYTYSHVRYLGLSEIVIGLIATYDMGYGLFYWAIGFGVLHILYGTIMYYKFEK
jgi:general stress protein CsbA